MGVDAKMYVDVPFKISPKEVKSMAIDLHEAFRSAVWVRRGEKHCLTIEKTYYQDGEDVTAEKGHTLIEVHLLSRYYGVEYERGPLPNFIAIAEWLEERLPGGNIFYGGDSSGVCAEPFDKKARELLWEHFCKVGHKPYDGYFQKALGGEHKRQCDFCEIPMGQYGFGGDGKYAAYNCNGCGYKEKTQDAGKTFAEVSKDEI